MTSVYDVAVAGSSGFLGSAIAAAVGADRLDVSLARDVLGWEPRVGLHEGVARAWASMRVR